MSRYRVVPDRSRVWIDAKSSLHPIHSGTDGLEGYVELEMAPGDGIDLVAAAPKAKLSLPVSRLSSGNPIEDREMQKRIDARRYPTIDGDVDRISSSSRNGSYRVSGDITFRGVSRHFEDDMTIDAVDDHAIALAGSHRFDIRDFGMEPPRVLMLRVEPEVQVRVEIHAVREQQEEEQGRGENALGDNDDVGGGGPGA